MSTRTYYRGPDAVVTDELFVWRGAPTKGYAIRDLRNVGRTRGDTDRLGPFRAFGLAGAVALAAAAWNTLGTPGGYAFGAMAVGLPATLAIASRMRRVPHWELRASYRNHEVILYSATDERVFNQVSRALRRSMEDARSPDPRPGFAAA